MNTRLRLRPLLSGVAICVVLAGCSGGSLAGGGDDATVEDGVNAYLQELAEMYGVSNPPPVTPLRAVRPTEQLPLIADCMNDAGWVNVSTSGGGLQVADVPGQENALNLALYTCFAQYPLSGKYLAAPSEDDWRELYDYYTSELAPCLRGLGEEIPTSPSFPSWLATTAEGDYWNPAEFVPVEDYPENECPRLPEKFS